MKGWLWMAGLCYGIVGAAMMFLPGWESWEAWQMWLAWAASPLIIAVLAVGAMALQFLFFAALGELTKNR